ncbi:O-antigen ligase family protein [Anaerohalosphaera lusitana]|uniref:O-antigen ligase family protein n=1 Tax=Anaerohalosphaera lusitana TaxID=1936003 RepID=UPI0014767FAE|nr:O-antigen ligase family protein [Anaerohalosphaera lusitana]
MTYALLLFMPAAFGVVNAWSEQVVIIVSSLILIAVLLRSVLFSGRFIWTWAYVPVLVFIGLVAFQLVDMPTETVEKISPNTAAIKTDLLSSLPDSADAQQESTSISFYKHATRHNLILVVAVFSMFIAAVHLFQREEAVKRLLIVISSVGCFMALLAIGQFITRTDSIYWVFQTPYKIADGGPFVNHSNYAQFMNLSIGAALGLLLYKIHDRFSGLRARAADVAEHLTSRESRPLWFLAGFVIIGVASIFTSLSRGGMVSMLVAASFTTLILTRRQSIRGRGWIMAVMALGAFICVLYIGFDAVYDRLATLQDMHHAEGGRMEIIENIALAWTKFPILGTGLGTHEVVYPMFDRATIASLATHAENEYAQTAEETGALGFLSLVVFGIFVWIAYTKNIRAAQTPIRSVAYGLGFGLLAILLHSFSDFGQHLPANSMLSAIFCGGLIGLAKKNSEQESIRKSALPQRICLAAALLAFVPFASWSMYRANAARIAEANFETALGIEEDLVEDQWQGDNLIYIDLISNAQTAVGYMPDNIKYRHWLNVYRWKSIARNINAETGTLTLPAKGLQSVEKIVDQFYDLIEICPTYGPSWCMAGQLEYNILGNRKTGLRLADKGYELAPYHSTACFTAGLLEILELVKVDNFDDSGALADSSGLNGAVAKLNRSVKLNGGMFDSVAQIYINEVKRPDLAVDLAGDKVWRLTRVANMVAESGFDEEKIGTIRQRLVFLLQEQASSPDAPASVFASLGGVYRDSGDIELAVEYYRKALQHQYDNVYWRLRLARLLAELKQKSEAIHEARIVLRLRPGYEPAERLIGDLSVERQSY